MAGIQDWRVSDASKVEAIAAGDWVRSYGFEFNTDYVLGRVLKVGVDMGGCPRYEIQPWKVESTRGLKGSINRERDNVFPPVNGTPHIFGGFCNGVRKCEGEELEYWTERFADLASDVETY